MACVVTESKVIQLGGSNEGRIRVIGSTANAAEVSFVIQPGYQDTNVSGSKGLNKIDSWGFSNQSAEKAPKIVKAYDATNDSDKLTVTCAAGDDFDYWVEGISSGRV